MKTALLLPSTETVPVPVPDSRNNGTVAVAFVLPLTFAVVDCDVNNTALGAVHVAVVDVPLKPVPVKVTSVPGHPDVGETEVRCHADAASALAKKTSSPSVPAKRLARLIVRRIVAVHASERAPGPRGALNVVMMIPLT